MKIIRSGEYTEIPQTKLILGTFIESGYGRQVAGMWSEMIYNRSFRTIPPYKRPTFEWLGLDKEHYCANAPFWHSGYEELDWQLIGEPVGTLHTLGRETHKGKSSYEIRSDGRSVCGVKQGGIHLKAGMTYHFRIFCGQAEGHSAFDDRISSFGQNVRTCEPRFLQIKIGDHSTEINVAGNPALHEWDFSSDKDEVAELSMTFAWKGLLILSFVSLMPDDNILGWRSDVVSLIKKAGPSVVRFPGGCFVSFFDWKTSVGNRDEREPQESFYWGGLEENDVGLKEFMELAQECDFEPQVCFNMMTSSPFDARCMVEYLNAPANVGYGRLRMLDGHPEPFGVRLFECDNETYRKWGATQYAQKCVEFAREMRLVSPEAEFMMVAYGYDVHQLPAMLEIAGGDVNYVIHRKADPEKAKEILDVLREYNERTGRSIRFVNTEWLPPAASPEPFDVPEIDQNYRWDGKIHNDYNKVYSRHQLCWNYALNGAHRILDYISYGGEFALANFNNMANTFGQNLIEAAKDGAWLSCMGEVFAFYKRNFKTCIAAHAECSDPLVFALFVREEDGKEKLYVINHGSAEKSLELPLEFSRCADGLTAPCRSTFVTATSKPVTRITPEVSEGKCVLPGLSVTVFE